MWATHCYEGITFIELPYVHRVGGVRCSALKVCNFDNYGMENYPEQQHKQAICKLTMVRLENIFRLVEMLVEILESTFQASKHRCHGFGAGFISCTTFGYQSTTSLS
jgi:hypothetical protein